MASSSKDSLSAAPRGLCASGSPVLQIPEIPLKLVRSVEITANFHRCKKNFVKFCTEVCGTRVMAKTLLPKDTEEDRRIKGVDGVFPIPAINHALDAISQMSDVEVDQETDLL